MSFTRPKRPKRLAWIVAFSLVLASAAALGWWAMRQPKLDRRIYRIGYEIELPVHFQTKDGQATGFAVDLINEAAARRGIRLQWLLEPESSEAALRAGKVDLWPMMTITPERKGVVYITDPYREAQDCLIVRMESPYTRLDDLRNATISYDGHPFDLKLLRSRLPKAQFTVIQSARQSMETVCEQRGDAAFLGEYTAIETLLNGIVCGGKGLRVIRIPELPILMEGIGATFEAKPVADALRAEIGVMAEDGAFARVASRWRSFSGRNLEVTDALIRVKRRERWLIAGISSAVCFLLLTLWQAVRIRRERNRFEQATAQLRQLAASLQNVRDEERTRIARELHDELGQALAAIKMDIGWAADRVPPGDKTFADRFQSTLALVDTTIRSMRKVATELRPSILDLGLNAAIEWLLEEFHSRTGVEYSLDLPNPEVVADPQQSTAIFRIFQEALTNVARHSRATCIDVRLERNNGDLILEVQDNGKGISQQPPPGPGGSLGILGMRERALALGGEVTVESPAAGGTVVRARIPLAENSPPVPVLGGTS
jgi:signal transduction histidine kinase